MGNSLACRPVSIDGPGEAPADKIQREVLERRRSDVANENQQLPRSTQNDQGTFVKVKEHFPDAHETSTSDVWRWRRNVVSTPRCTEEDLKHLPLMQLDKRRLESPERGSMQVTWIGHASVLVQFDGWNILSDPIFSRRCSPVQLRPDHGVASVSPAVYASSPTRWYPWATRRS